MRIVLVLMVKNEAKILSRCLASARDFVDAVVIADTGSTDDTVRSAQEILAGWAKPHRVSHHVWRDFGHNRTLSLEDARELCRELAWPLEETHALVLDADMVFKGSSREKLQKALDAVPASGFSVKQVNGFLEYYNTRFMRLSDPWFCEGVTHEYWTGGGVLAQLEPEFSWISDLGDGGCKDDKFERDERLLLAGLAKKPSCERYMFYLAQTYNCLNRDDEALEWYEKRIKAGGWFEEVWYAHLMMARLLLKKDEAARAEEWVEKGLVLQPDRVEGLLSLITYFREKSHHFKAWRYLKLAEKIPLPSSAKLFLEVDAYGHRLDYERSILHFYTKPDAKSDGAFLCLRYEGPQEVSVMTNLSCYTFMVQCSLQKQLHFPTPDDFKSSSVCIDETGTRLCVRAVSYYITANGCYITREGLIETRNFEASWDPEARNWEGWKELVPDPMCCSVWGRNDVTIRGLEDMRTWGNVFTATTREFSYCDANRMVVGQYDTMTFWPVKPPRGETSCEKNWVPVSEEELIYEWHPLTIGRVNEEEGRLQITREHATPRWFRHLRGSASPVELEDGLWTLVHIVSPRTPRVYLHMWVLLSASDHKPLAYTPPFCIKHWGIEYCLGTTVSLDRRLFGFFVSAWDRESWYCEASVDDFRKLLRPLQEAS